MTQTEFETLEVGDTVYYYNPVNVKLKSHVSAALKKKTVGSIHIRDDGERRISFTKGGVILMSLLYMFDTDKDKLLYKKLVEIKKKINEAVIGKHRFDYPRDLKEKYSSILQQKNVQPMLIKYPELLI